MPNAFAHIELTSIDPALAKKFYAKVFSWKLSDVPGMPYTMIDVGGGTGGGIQPQPMPDAPTGWMPYVEVESVEKTMKKAVAAGATALLPFQDIGDMGSIGVFADPQGSVIGVWASKPGQAGTNETKPVSEAKPTKKAAKRASQPTKKPAKKPTKKAAPKAKKAAKKAPSKKVSKKASAKKR